MRIIGLGHVLFALAAAGLAILSLAYWDFAPMWHAFPVWIPWRNAWVYGFALLLLAAGAGLCFSRTALPSALTIAAYQAVWALTCATPVILKPLTVGAWYGFCEALTPVLGAWILYTQLRRPSPVPAENSIAARRGIRAAQVLFGFNCVVYGMAHFAYADLTASMVPSWLHGGFGFAYVTGLAHIAAGIGIMIGILARLAATIEAIMMSVFGLLVWVPSFIAQPRPAWATPPQNQWSEAVVTLLLTASAWVIAASLQNRILSRQRRGKR
jgi:uncharacterized membrane protein